VNREASLHHSSWSTSRIGRNLQLYGKKWQKAPYRTVGVMAGGVFTKGKLNERGRSQT